MLGIFFFADSVHAQPEDTFGIDPVDEVINLEGGQDIRIIVAQIIRAVLGLLGLLTVIIMLYGGYTIMTSGGQEDKITRGKKILVNATIGLAIIFTSFAIVQFIMNALGNRGLGTPGDVSVSGPTFQSFAGSGSLGRIIRDHFPFRDQLDVPRNTKIIVTFSQPITASSLIEDTNGNGKVGDCVTPDGESLNVEAHCDHLLTSAVEIFPSSQAEGQKTFVGAAAMALYDAEGNTEIFVFRPFEPIGSSIEQMWYTVDLKDPILLGDGKTGAFDNQISGHYEWEFQAGTTFDFIPPHVISVYPRNGGVAPRNSIVQIHFNEAMDPTAVQGLLSSDGTFTNMIFGSATVSGEWKITNGYKSVEFVSDQPCGQNSCGDIMYCLPIDCPATDTSCTNPYSVLARAADLEDETSETPFLSVLFSGVMDIAGNALDNGIGGPDGVPSVPPKPGIGLEKQISDDEKAPDNYWWDFSIQNKIDRAAPYVSKVNPGLDNQSVKGKAPLEIFFSKLMKLSSMPEHISVTEHPANVNGMDDIWYAVFSQSLAGDTTKAIIPHREFGPNNLDLYYFPSVGGRIMGVNQNCLYPGRGPDSDTGNIGISPECSVEYDELGYPISVGTNCVGVNTVSSTDTGCIITTASYDEKIRADVTDCLDFMKRGDVSPSQL
ncbi:MAG: hypothetical protein ABII02_01395 [Candidatus Magasanikbacteria bacterium]